MTKLSICARYSSDNQNATSIDDQPGAKPCTRANILDLGSSRHYY